MEKLMNCAEENIWCTDRNNSDKNSEVRKRLWFTDTIAQWIAYEYDESENSYLDFINIMLLFLIIVDVIVVLISRCVCISLFIFRRFNSNWLLMGKNKLDKINYTRQKQ